MRTNKHVEASGRILSTRAENLFWNVVHFLIPLFLPLFISFFPFSSQYYVLYWKRPHSKCAPGLKPMWDVPHVPWHASVSSESWDVIVFTHQVVPRTVFLQIAPAWKRWSCRWVICKRFLLDGQFKELRTLRGPSWVIITKAYFLNTILHKLLSDKNY